MNSRHQLPLLAEASANGNGADQQYAGGRTRLLTEATGFGGGTVTVQFKTPRGNYITVTGLSGTANALSDVVELPAGVYRAVLAGATGPTGVYAVLLGTAN